MFIRKQTYNELESQRELARQGLVAMTKLKKEAEKREQAIIKEMTTYKAKYAELYDSIKDDIKDPSTKVRLEPTNVESEVLASKYTDVKDDIPEVVDESIGGVTAVIYGAGVKESLDARKASDGCVKRGITVVVDTHNDCFALGQYDLDNDYETIIDDFDASNLNNVYVLEVELPKFKPYTINI